ncbi:hypothetical protein L6452_11109 [Arctium lappa]|uniref:Uncharacterized protein n=1 Tax=Arctium lappa TaxID=4217 RepID=A0ACB9DNS2_ARCLA|nr:hypothetical protein L6452_11109 [Arctium lappa]
MELGSILDFLDNKTILVTGATGFLAKIFVEKILRVQPNVKKLYLLVRATDAKSALQRFNTEAVAKDLFKILKDKYGTNLQSFLSEKVTPVAGDITNENLGVTDFNLIEEMWRNVDVVVNVAATTNFDERYDVALALNTFGAKNVLNFAVKCVKLKLLLHVSTAYVSGEKPGLILETPYKLGETLNGANGLDINTEKKIIEEKLKELSSDETATDKSITLAMKDLGIERANKFGWPNTYVFTKALGEMILGHLKGNMPLVILRPTIITSTYKEPFPGWIEGIRTIDSLAMGYGKGRLSCFLGDPESVIDVIPADMVVNAMITTMVAHANQPCEMIYHVGSSVSNPLKYKGIQKSGYRYFSKHPWINKDGKAVIVGEVKVLNSMESFRRYFSIRYMLPLQGLQFVNSALCHAFNGTYTDLKRKINFVLRVVELYKPYLFSKSFYDDMNTEKLRQIVRENVVEDNIFYFDPKLIDWDNYFVHIHIPGAVKHKIVLFLRPKYYFAYPGAKLTLSSPSVFSFHPKLIICANTKMASAIYNLTSLGCSKPQAPRSPDSRRSVGAGVRRTEVRCEAAGVAAENRQQLVTTVKNGNDSLEICRVLNGMWQTSGGWGRIDRDDAVDAMLKYADAGLSTFDMADHCKIHEFRLTLL